MSDDADNESTGNLPVLAEVGKLLIEKVASAAGVLYEPVHIKRIAMAEAMANEVKAVSDIRITDLQRRAANTFVNELILNQYNKESVTTQALPELKETARPQDIENDWMINFFDKVRLISDEQMQKLWAKLLAGEANAPGNYSKRTINLLSSLDKSDAELFTQFNKFVWFIDDSFIPLIYDNQHEIYTKNKITFNDLMHLDSLGLITFSQSMGGYSSVQVPKSLNTHYYGTQINIEFPDEVNQMAISYALFTQSGQELALLCNNEPIPEFLDYVLTVWRDQNLITSSPYPRAY
jgi:hypothetical protein